MFFAVTLLRGVLGFRSIGKLDNVLVCVKDGMLVRLSNLVTDVGLACAA